MLWYDFGGVVVGRVVEKICMLFVEVCVFFELVDEVFGGVADAVESLLSPEVFFVEEEAASSAFVVAVAGLAGFTDGDGGVVWHGSEGVPGEFGGDGAGEYAAVGGDGVGAIA